MCVYRTPKKLILSDIVVVDVLRESAFWLICSDVQSAENKKKKKKTNKKKNKKKKKTKKKKKKKTKTKKKNKKKTPQKNKKKTNKKKKHTHTHFEPSSLFHH